MVKITQNVEAAYEAESTYGDPPDTTLLHFGLLDTFDPRAVEMNITPVPSIGQSTDAFHARGPINVTLPLKVACQGTGWQALLGRAIGGTSFTEGGGSVKYPLKLTNSADSIAVLARETGGDYTLVGGVVPNEVTLTADYTAGGYITLDANCTAQFTEDSTDGDFSGGFYGDNYSNNAFPAAPSADPLLATDLTVSVGEAAATSKITIDGPPLSYVEVGERFIRLFDDNTGTVGVESGDSSLLDTGINADGTIDLTNGSFNTLTNLASTINGDGNWSCSATNSVASLNLLKGIYNTAASRDIFATTNMTSVFTNLKTVSLKIANNNVSIPGKTGTTWLQNNKIARGKADVTLDLTMTAEDETYYDKYKAGTTIPLIRLDFGSSGSIALTNGTITSFSRPLSPGGEIVDTMSIKFRGAGDYKDFSSYAISADWTL
tara:strand:+ start:674 stop:1975 length:1302 start_codon:yes stop_codon:yes gene_type:complete